jgi:integrase
MLNAKKLAALIRHGRRGRTLDANGLYLQIGRDGAASWVRRYQPPGAQPVRTASGKMRMPDRFMGLGSVSGVTLAAAREHNRKISALLAQGIDPIDAKRDAIVRAQIEKARSTTFGKAAQQYFHDHSPGWGEKHKTQWRSTVLGLTEQGRPVRTDYLHELRLMPVHAIDTTAVLKVLRPMWQKKPVTAQRLRERIETVLDASTAEGARSGDNPARHELISLVLPSIAKIATVEHFAAVPPDDVPGIVTTLQARDDNASRALLVTILCATRTQETLQATWPEFDLDIGVWTIPATRMKKKREHRVPLSSAALTLLRALPRHDAYVFPGTTGQPLSPPSMLRVLHAIGRTETVHGLRSSFADWAAEHGFSPDLVEIALAHLVGTKTTRAYARSDLIEQRRVLMQAWGDHCTGVVADNVRQLERRA